MWTLFTHKSCSRHNHLKVKELIFFFNCPVSKSVNRIYKWSSMEMTTMQSGVEKITSTETGKHKYCFSATRTNTLSLNTCHHYKHYDLTLSLDVCIYYIITQNWNSNSKNECFIFIFSLCGDFQHHKNWYSW